MLAGKNAEKRYEAATSGVFLGRLNTKVTFKSIVHIRNKSSVFASRFSQGSCPRIIPKLRVKIDGEWRALKVGYRAKSIKRATAAFVSQDIDEFELREKSREEQRQALLGLYGIGPASVGYILFDVFHHMNELETISPWEQRIYSKLFFDTEPDTPISVEQLLAYFNDQFGEYRMLAVHYLWQDLFWNRKNRPIGWLEKLIRL